MTTLDMAPLATTNRIRTSICRLEALELAVLGAVLALMVALSPSPTPAQRMGLGDYVSTLLVVYLVGSGLWLGYLLYIRLARVGGPAVDFGLWVMLAVATSSFTFWCWTVLDINRWLLSKLFYQGDAPVEFAWSNGSKQRRKAWEQARKSASTPAVA